MQASNHDIWQDIRGWHCDWLHIHHLIHPCRAAPQRYSVVGFIDKNKDTLFQDFKRLLYNRWNTHTHSYKQAQTLGGIYCRSWSFFVSTVKPASPVPTRCWRRCGLRASSASLRSPSDRWRPQRFSKTPWSHWWRTWQARWPKLTGLASGLSKTWAGLNPTPNSQTLNPDPQPWPPTLTPTLTPNPNLQP